MRTLYVEITRRRTLRLSERWGWRASNANGKVIATSHEGYYNEDHAEKMAHQLFDGHPYYKVNWR